MGQMKNLSSGSQLAVASLLCMLTGTPLASGTGGLAPEFSLPESDGNTLSLTEHRGEVVMINFWATWCGPCRQEMPLLDALYDRYHDLGFTLIGVNVDEDSSVADGWLADRPVSFPIVYDPDSNVSRLYDVTAMPSTVIVDRSGQMRFRHYGYQPGYENDYQDQIRQLIRER
jgi:peroxiredoxin